MAHRDPNDRGGDAAPEDLARQRDEAARHGEARGGSTYGFGLPVRRGGSSHGSGRPNEGGGSAHADPRTPLPGHPGASGGSITGGTTSTAGGALDESSDPARDRN